jgi:hypothetical protein
MLEYSYNYEKWKTTRCDMPVSQFLKETKKTIFPYVQMGYATLSRFSPLQQLLLGYQQFFNAVNLWDAPVTKKILLLSAYTNLIDYLLPFILYRRAIDAVKEYSPSENTDYMIDQADALIMSTIMLRLYMRRVWDNTFYTAALPRAIAADNQAHTQLVMTAAAEFVSEAVCVTHAFFLRPDVARTILHADLKRDFLKLFSALLVGKNPDSETLKQQLAPAIKKILNGLRHTHQRQTFFGILNDYDLDQYMATAIANGFVSLYSAKHQQEYEASLAEIKKFFESAYQFRGNHNVVADFKATLDKGFAAQKSFLPIKYQPPCGCNLKKVIHAGVSSPVYYATNHFINSLPEKFYKHQMISEDNYFYLSWASTLVGILIYGQGLNEYKVSPEDNCTRHRYEVFARNYFHSLGVGLGLHLGTQAAVHSIYYATGIKSYYVQDAFFNVLMQFGVVSMLAFNDPLTGNLRIWDLFAIPREMTSSVVAFLQRRFTPNMEKKESRDSVIAYVYQILSSRKCRYFVDLILSGGDYFPRRELLTWGAWRKEKSLTQDPRRVIFDNKAFKQFYDMFKSDIEVAIQKIKIAHYCSTWMSQPLLTAMRAPGGLMALIVDVLQIMKDECLDDIMKSNKLDELLLFYRQELMKDEVIVTIPAAAKEPRVKDVSAEVNEEEKEAVVPVRTEKANVFSMNIDADYYSPPQPFVESVIMHLSPAPVDNFMPSPEEDDKDEFMLVDGRTQRRPSLIEQGLFGLKKLTKVVKQVSAGELNAKHASNSVVRYKS